VTTDPEKLKAVKCCPPPTDKHQLRSFVGLCTYYRRFIPVFAGISRPFTRVQGLQEYNFTLEHRQGHKHTNADALFKRQCSKNALTARKLDRQTS
jgi:hypothetical protein